METTSSRKTNKKSATTASEASIQLAYIDYLLNHGQRPPSVFKFAHDLGIKEDVFYNHFGSFEGLERYIWKVFMEHTLQRLQADKDYSGFSIREKILAFYYTFFEDLRANRSFILLQLEQQPREVVIPDFLRDLKVAYDSYIKNLLTEGKGSEEIANRPYLDKTYPHIFWMQLYFLLMFWKKDNSPGFEQTDAAIEKSVNLALDLIGKGAVDSVFDFAKFLFQTSVR